MSGDGLRERIRTDSRDIAAAHAWERDHPSTPWGQAPESVRAAMRALVGPVVASVLTYLDDADLLDLEPEPDTYPMGTPVDVAVSWTYSHARSCGMVVRHVHHGAALIAFPADSWHDTAGRYADAAEQAARS